MKLTRRQEEIINKLFDLYREHQEPIHYTALAERLGVSRFTAYDMLRLLEEKGLVESEYRLAPDKSGPGRTERVFLPTRLAQEFTHRLAEEVGGASWETFKQRVLEKFRKGEMYDPELVEEMLVRIPPEGRGQLRFCVEVMTIVALRLRNSSGRGILLEYMPQILPAQEPARRANLCLLGGIALGILIDEDTGDREWGQQLFEHVHRYLDIVVKMNVKNCRLLGEYLINTFAPLADEP